MTKSFITSNVGRGNKKMRREMKKPSDVTVFKFNDSLGRFQNKDGKIVSRLKVFG